MKRVLALVLAFCLLISCAAWAENAAEDAPAELGENEILMHGYIDPYVGYYVGVPAEWALIGAGSTLDDINQASDIIDESVSAIIAQLTADNDILFAVSPSGENLILTYGSAAGATNADLIDSMAAFQKELSANYPGIRFTDECGSFKINDISEILLIAANYNGHDIRQYYMTSGTTMYIFTFTGVSADIAYAVLSLFHV